MEFAVLGPLQVHGEHGPVEVAGAKERALLAHLVAAAGRVVPVDELVDTLWGDSPPRSAAKSLQNAVLRLRNALEPDRQGTPRLLITEGHGYRLAVPEDAVDAHRFARLVALGRQALAGGRPDAAAATLADALALWRGRAYAGFEDTGFGGAEARRLEELRIGAIEDRLAAELQLGRSREALPELESAVYEHPLRERLWHLLVLALYRSGRQADALAAYGRARRVLVDELGVEPGDDLRSLHAQILSHDEALAHRPAAGALPPGLQPPGGPFVGREPELDVLRGAWAEVLGGRPVTVVVRGPRGAGARRLAAELAAEVADGGYDVEVAGGAGLDEIVPRPRLTVVTRAPPAVRPPPPGTGPRLTVVLATPRLADLDTVPVVDLGPLPQDAVRAIVGTYLDPDEADAALPHVLRASGGLPGPVHEVALRLAREGAAQRIQRATRRTERMQRALDDARDELRTEVTGLHDALDTDPRPGTTTCPWRGLAAYDVPDAAWFAGRERLVAELVARVAPADLLAVAGASGSGKSSVVRAGLLASLQAGALPGSESWRYVLLRPGTQPVRELLRLVAVDGDEGSAGERLARAVIAEEAPRVVLVVDQLEEVWTACGDQAQRDAFLDALAGIVAAGAGWTVVLVVRGDYVGELASHRALSGALAGATVLVGSSTETEIRRAVEHPAERAGLVLDAGLADAVVADAATEPGALPLLSTALAELWEQREGRRLTLAGYVRVGGVRGALARMAERAYGELDEPDRHAARVLLLRLAGPGEAEAPTRRRVPLAELAALPETRVRAVVDPLAAARLLTVDAGHVEVAHEALFREWPRLLAWLHENAAARAVQPRLAVAAAEWDADGRDPTDLWRGPRLAAAAEFAATHPIEVTDVERAFVAAAQERLDAERRTAEERAATATRQNRRLKVLIGGLAMFLALAVATGTLAVLAGGRAERQAAVATARELAAAAVATLDADPELAVLLALEAVDRAHGTPVLQDASNALHAAVVRSRVVATLPDAGGEVAWSPDGSMVVTEGPVGSGAVDVRDAAGYDPVRRVHPHAGDVLGLVFSPAGSLAASTGAGDGTAAVWDAATAETVATFTGTGDVHGPTFSADGSLVAAVWGDEGVLRIGDVATGRVLREVPVLEDGAEEPSFAPDGTRIAAVTSDPWVPVVLDTRTGETLLELPGHEVPVTDVDWSPDGRWISTTSLDYSVRIWNARSGARRYTLEGHSAPVDVAAWSTDSSRIATGSQDGTVRVWEVTGEGTRPAHVLAARAIRDGVAAVAFSPDGTRLVAGSEAGGGVLVWDVSPSGDAEWSNYPTGLYSGADFVPAGDRLVLADPGGAVTVWDTATRSAAATFGPHARQRGTPYPNFQSIDVSPDGALTATSATDSTATIWTTVSGEEIATVDLADRLGRREAWVDTVAWHPDGRALAISSWAGVVLIVDRSGSEVALLEARDGFRFEDVRFSPDGGHLAVVTYDREHYVPEEHVVQVWDWRRGTVVHTLPSAATALSFHPDGDRLATAAAGAAGEVWDVDTAERLLRLSGHEGTVVDVAYNADGSRIATGSTDRTARTWDAGSGRLLDVLGGHASEVTQVVFSPDGSRLASVSGCCLARLWALDLDDLVRIAQRQVTRDLVDEECRRFLHRASCPGTVTG